MEIKILADADAIAREAAKVITAEAHATVAARGRFIGGKTPWQMLRELANEEVPWPDVHMFQVDEHLAAGPVDLGHHDLPFSFKRDHHCRFNTWRNHPNA